MIYAIFKPFIRIALSFFCRKIYINHRNNLQIKGPLLIVANHPNSFLDAIIIGAFFKNPIHFLARGDAFKKKHHRFFLRLLNMIPIYRLSEGKENLYLNEYAFNQSKKILEKGGIVLIFIEGICLLTNQLQPFKKGAARIALDYQGKKPLKILPVGIAYDRFNAWAKTVQISIGESIESNNLFPFCERAKNMNYFNIQIKQALDPLIIQPVSANTNHTVWMQFISLIGYYLHNPLFKVIDQLVKNKTRNTVFYDSVLFGILFLIYPLFLLIIGVILNFLFGIHGFFLLSFIVIAARTIVLCRNPIK
ncbi:1-acyl-sn-glycerol-3-phosphate acyltransferase [Sediminibacterium sp.]|uniref:1-acyl-sn-glycerol-3-phosphate acyltransferase n=1 Tax=Sediminibacterium sp. TaxID=1917865 RepID=UPI003F705B3D